MAKFIFRMNHILGLKEKLEEQAKLSYGNARLKLTEEENKLKAFQDQKTRYEEQYKRLLQTKLNLREIRTIQHAIDTTKGFIKQQKIAVKAAENSLEAARIRLNKAMVERKTYEVLKEKAFEQFKQEVGQAEQKEIDELVSYKFNSPTSYEEEQ